MWYKIKYYARYYGNQIIIICMVKLFYGNGSALDFAIYIYYNLL